MFNWNHDCSKHGHEYEARYDSRPSGQKSTIERGTLEALRLMLEHNAIKTYVQDVCVKCGDIKKRSSSNV